MDLHAAIAGREIIGYGGSLALLGAQETHPLPLAYVVDDTPGFAGQTIAGVAIRDTASLASESRDDVFVMIYAFRPDSLRRIAARLHQWGYRSGEHFTDCSRLHRISMGARMQTELGLRPDDDTFEMAKRLTLFSIPRNLSGIAGTWLWLELAHAGATVEGSVIECGAYEGGNAYVSLVASESMRARPYYLVDTFDGLPEVSALDPRSRGGEFGDVDLASVRDRFAEFPNVRVHQGLFATHLPRLTADAVAFAYVDGDLYEGAVECCEWIWPRLSSGGALFFHDAWTPTVRLPEGAPAPFTGIQRAIDEYFGARGARVITFPETTHVVVRKP